MAVKFMHCRNCRKATTHTAIHVSGLGEDNPTVVSRLLTGVITMGMSEVFAETDYECQECGRRR